MPPNDPISAYYDDRAETEWQRLEEGWLEFAVTLHFVERLVPSGAEILDLGGGPGRYAIELSARGYAVDLLDISPGCIGLARTKAEASGQAMRTADIGDARDLSHIADARYDAVLNLGPLYHLRDPAERDAAVEESLRVLRPGGHAFFAFLSRYAPVYYVARTRPGDLGRMRPAIDRILADGDYRPDPGDDFFVDAHFTDPSTIAPFMDRPGLLRRALFGAESVLGQSATTLGKLSTTDRRRWLALAIDLAESDAALYASEHLVFAGEKTTG